MALNLDKIKSLFIVPEDEIEGGTTEKTEKKEEPKKEEPPKVKTSTTSSPIKTSLNKQASTQAASTTKGEVNKNIFNSLTKAIMDANLPGEDYLEFIGALKAMKDLPLEESVKMQTVLATLSTKGLTVQKIIESADYYIKVLENEKDKFNQALQHQTSGKIGTSKKKITTLEEANVKKAEKIKLLTDEINKNKQEIDKIKKEIAESDAKIKKTENDFKTTFDYVANQIIDKVEKIKNLTT